VADLITKDDLKPYGATDEQLALPLVDVLIGSASDAVIDAAGSPILESRSTVEITAMPARILRLPGLPVREIHSVTIDGQPVTGWTRIAAGIYREPRWSHDRLEIVTVEYTHGLPAVPNDVKDLVARMVLAGLIAAEDGPAAFALNNGGVSSVAIDDFKEAYATGVDVEAVTEMTLPERTRRWLERRFGGGGPNIRGQL
jgi:hypothetical protein